MIIRHFILFFFFFVFFSKTVWLSSVFNAEMKSTCQNTLITAFLWDFGEKSGFSPNFCPYCCKAMWRLWAKKLINTISATFGVFPSKNNDSIVLCNSASKFQRKSQKIKNNNQTFYFIFCIFLKNHSVELSFQCRNEILHAKIP